jgi:hypothetical protein
LKNSSAGRCSIAFSISCTVLMVGMLSRRCLSRNFVFSLSAESLNRNGVEIGRLTRPTDTEAWRTGGAAGDSPQANRSLDATN